MNPSRDYWVNVYEGNRPWLRALGGTCTTREVAEHCARRVTASGHGPVLYRLHVKPKARDRVVDLQDVFGYGPSAPGWREPAR